MRKNRIVGIVVGLLILTLSVFGELKVKEIVAFGDSLTCTGNACIHAENPSTMCLLFPQGKFTDGDVWLEVLADKLGLPQPTASLIGGSNFAYGGATTGRKHSKHLLNVGSQIDAYLERSGRQANPETLYVIWAGGNDLKNKILPADLISNMQAHIEELVHSGAKQFLVPNFPPVGNAPTVKKGISLAGKGLGWLSEKVGLVDDRDQVGGGVISFLEGFAQVGIEFYNNELEIVLAEIEKTYNIKIYRFDSYAYFGYVRNNLHKHGIKDEMELYLYDGFHPSKTGHYLIAHAVYRELHAQSQ